MLFLFSILGVQTQTSEGDPGPQGAAITPEQSARRPVQLLELKNHLNLPVTYLICLLLTLGSVHVPL